MFRISLQMLVKAQAPAVVREEGRVAVSGQDSKVHGREANTTGADRCTTTDRTRTYA